jgi:glutamate dehydrogenase
VTGDGELLDEVIAGVAGEFEPGDRAMVTDFAQAYLRRRPAGDERSAAEWLAEIRGMFEFIRVRTDPFLVRVFNPDPETDGYGSRGTVVEVNIEDGPFLLDSLTNEIQAHGLEVARVTHPVIGADRDSGGRLTWVGHARHARNKESVEHYELDRKLFPADLPGLERAIHVVLSDIKAAVRDFHPMMDRIKRMVEVVRGATGFYPEAEIGEAIAFLQWLRDENFVFLGYREYKVGEEDGEAVVRAEPGTGLGILSDKGGTAVPKVVALATLRPELAARYRDGDLLIITKTNRLSTVHRRVRLDYVGVRIIGPSGATLGEARLVGLFTSKAFMEPASHVPILRRKLADIVANEDLIEGSHDHKAVIQIFEGYSKHDLFTAPTAALQRELMGLLALQETHQVRLFLRRDIMERSVSILVALPRDRFNADLRKALQDLFMSRFNGTAVDYHLELGESDPARIHFTVWVDGQIPEVGYDQLEGDVLSMTRSWSDRVTEELTARIGLAEARRLAEVWTGRFPDYYRVSASLGAAAEDVLALEALSMSEDTFHVGLRNETEAGEPLTRVVLYRSDGKRPLSELVPALEDMGMKVVEEVPTRIGAGDKFFIHDFGVLGADGEPLDLKGCENRVSAALTAVWSGEAESDSLNALVISGGMTHRAVGILRAYRVYWRRLALSFTVGYLNDVLNAHPQLAADLITLFELRFDPENSEVEPDSLERSIQERLDAIPSLDHDRILRSFYRLIKATLRTNAYQVGRKVLSIKIRSRDVPDMPKPVPFAEIFVYGLEIEGIHLRGGPVARGGIRWSDRREDYRTEVLGLMKAQITKNAVIVPTGAKGGFVLRKPPADPMLVQNEVREQYESYIRALLDVTDNLEKGEPVYPERVRVHDDPDPYLVVAADRGTATFSDLANSIALEKGFWLGDAFASGGSAGYDHKKLGITARGAWKSLERHFIELGLNPHVQPFTAVGIGDMSGDVFGNGMLGSDQIRLVAAFDHRHIFIDPEPDPHSSFAERKRLFDLPRSSWDDYDRRAISPGGGVWSRSVKQIELSPQARAALGVSETKFAPLQLVRAILLAPVDLLWNGGIGTYVKASTESNEAVGDRGNDPVRVDGVALRCRVVVEGGNLGLTQAGRVEYAMAGGKINTDFIDNSGGVNCSDREVNLKILLGLAEERGQLTRAERDRLVAASAPQVVDRILYDNFQQAQMISQEERAALRRVGAHEQLMVQLENEGLLDRTLEGVPSTEVLTERSRGGKGLTRPEIAVLLVDAKRSLKVSLASSDLVDDPSLLDDLKQYFPDEASARFESLIPVHPLRRELSATILANDVVNSVGATFVSRMTTRSGAAKADVVKAYRIARDVSNAKPRWEEIERLVDAIDLNVWFELMTGQDRVVASLTRRYLVRLPKTTLAEAVADDRPGFAEFEDALTEAGPDDWRQAHRSEEEAMVEAGVALALARRHVFRRQLVHAPNAIELAKAHGRKVAEVAEIMFHAGVAVGLDRLESIAGGYHFTDSWQRWALEALEDDLVEIRRTLTKRILQSSGELPPQEALAEFMEAHAGAIGRLNAFVNGLGTEQPENLAPLMIGIRQLRALIG